LVALGCVALASPCCFALSHFGADEAAHPLVALGCAASASPDNIV